MAPRIPSSRGRGRGPRAHPGHGLGPAGGFSWHGRAHEQNLDLLMANESNETSLGNAECSVSVNELHCTEIGWKVKISI